ncbi:TPA: restriction endonuclease subunit S [Escherichia coli]|uniref:restriction endonuclease subunit S n=1 Tax=Escherichia coli TaxID=562 RepID=UPI001ED67A03|nr:restriction endonuclease subunit S [Escherichia coli]EFI4020285.1 restriction endonuclease subunit S [Escherichia coli]MDZ3866655.1 restriction endonuclease subunit S [Escherichia coli]HBK2950493.1 restriction endonuclease subunit S [Escherichia coli]HEC3574339.1 restriction endonuclease subunit S [Escherichia coli]
MSAGKLPEGWVDTQLGNVVDYGKTSKKVLSEVNDDTWILELEDIEKDSSKLLNKVTASERPFKSTKNSFRKGDILYGKLRPYLNKIIIANDDGVCTTEIIPINAEPICFNKYLFYWLKSSTFLSYVNDVSYGVNMPRLGTTDGLKAPLRLAPLAEQKIIAEKLDTLLAQVDSTKARLEQIPQILKRFRQAILANAVDGKLTDEWRAGKCYITEIKKISDIIQNAQVGLVRSASDQSEICTQKMRTPYIKMNNIHNVLGTNLEKIAYVSCDSYELEKYRLKNGDWLFNTRNSYELVGKSCVWNGCNNAVYNNNILRVRLKENYNSVFLDYWFHSFYGVSILNSIKSATTNVAAIYQKELLSKSVPFPPLPEQHEIVRRVEQLFAYADTIEKQVNNALARVNNLTQSILAKAFRGELTAQWRAENPELISGENSAAALLEKIKAERAASGGKKASRRKF